MTLIVRNSSLESGVVQILTILTSTITGVQIVKRGTHTWGKLGETTARARVPSPFPSLVFSRLLFFLSSKFEVFDIVMLKIPLQMFNCTSQTK